MLWVMTDATYFGNAATVPRVRTQDMPRPEPRRCTAPVFVYDCVTPLGGETLLSLLMKRMMKEAEVPDDGPD